MNLSCYKPESSLIPVGFNNLGATCYYNALLQSLLSCTSFIEEIMSLDRPNDIFVKLLQQLIIRFKLHEQTLTRGTPADDNIITEINNLGPATWKAMIREIAGEMPDIVEYIAGEQCAAEGFSLFLQALEKYKNVQNIFYHRRRNKFYCNDCESYFSQVNETDNIFKVEVAATQINAHMPTDARDINEFLLNQIDTTDADCRCSNCSVKSQKIKHSTLVMIPEVLFVMSKKYKFENGYGSKLHILVDFPETLSFQGHNELIIYKAVAQIQHVGNLDSGHYYSICQRKNEWFCIDDMNISKASFSPDVNTYIVLYHVI